MQVFINSIIPIILGTILLLSGRDQIEAKRSKTALKQCQSDECNLKPQHYALYSFVKEAIDTRLDLNGKEIFPFLKSVEVLRRRFSFEDANLNGTKLVQSLLANEILIEAEKAFKSEQGSALVDLYRSPVNGRSQNLACSQLRVQALERASKILNSNQQMAQVFSKIHRNFMRKSAKKCLKHSCNSIETSMSKLQSVLAKYQPEDQTEPGKINDDNILNDDSSNGSSNHTTGQTINDYPSNRREFESQELELCKFFKRTNATDCKITGNELNEINLAKGNFKDISEDGLNKTTTTTTSTTKNRSFLVDLLKAYRINYTSNNTNLGEQIELDETGRVILSQCRPINSLLDYNLAAIKWYRNQGLIDNQKLSNRSFWCPSLAYWLQLDRLCGELELSLESLANNGTFSY